MGGCPAPYSAGAVRPGGRKSVAAGRRSDRAPGSRGHWIVTLTRFETSDATPTPGRAIVGGGEGKKVAHTRREWDAYSKKAAPPRLTPGGQGVKDRERDVGVSGGEEGYY